LDAEQLGTAQEEIAKSYDDFPYESVPFPLSHPDRLATLGTLFGMKPPPVSSCRVLELGCASGGNLIPMACQLPGSEFLGMDLSANQVREGIKLIERLGLSNISLEHNDILALGDEIGKFDYIICHGVYSWVPEEVKDKILALCSGHLTRDGIAHISYNTYPGWHMREMIRNMMRYHVRQIDDTQTKVNQARALLDFLSTSVPTEDNPYGLHIKHELEVLRDMGDHYIAHEQLGVCNTPVYFHQFAEHAMRHGLQYLAESEFSKMLANNLSSEVATTLEKIGGDIIQKEQYMDFVRNRYFRSTLLCHKEQVLERSIDPGVISKSHLAAQVEPQSEALNFESPTQDLFKDCNGGKEFNVMNPITKVALILLNEAWPSSISFQSLCEKALAKLDRSKDDEIYRQYESPERALMTDLMQCYTANVVELRVCPVQFVTEVSNTPAVTPLARCQAEAGHSITNQRHERVVLIDFAQHVIRFLDGQHDRQSLVDELMTLLDDGVLVMTDKGEKMEDQVQARSNLQTLVDNILEQLPARAILIA